tara:strand:- start:683 stop:904 length:222 start_codon:yes stop_codon:yes gene_type:complete
MNIILKDVKKINVKYGIVYKNGSFVAVNGKTFDKDQMKKAISQYKGANRIHKPLALLFYSDIMNNKNVKTWSK